MCYYFSINIISVGNIPYEATEENLKEIFLQAGPVVSFRLVNNKSIMCVVYILQLSM